MARDFKIRSLTKLNVKNFVDMIFLREGLWTNIVSGQLAHDNQDISVLIPDNNAVELLGLQPGQVYQSVFREWVHESGVPLDGTNLQEQPIAASGCYVHGAFRFTNDPTFPHKIDYPNGRIIFDNPISPETLVHSDFSFRHVRVGFENRFNQQHIDSFLESTYRNNPETSLHITYPSGNFQPFPAVLIEIDNRKKRAYEMGNRSAIITDILRFHIWTLDDLQRDDIVDILDAQWHKRIPIIDFNRVPTPLSGLFNTLNDEFIPYQLLLNNPLIETTVGSGRAVRYLADIDDSFPQNIMSTENFERSEVEWELSIYLNAPNTPLQHTFAPVRPIPPDIDFPF